MSKKKKFPLDTRGGVLLVSRAMREQDVYVSMPPTAKVLMDLLQMQWRDDRPVAYGVREASNKIHCNVKTACIAFKILEQRGFIYCAEESLFNSRTGSKVREWRLTWMPYMDREPTHNWEKWDEQN
jgi:hypothetical protein